jgi:hypothetical protein
MFCQVGITANISSNLNDNVVAIVPANTDTIIQTGTSNAGVQLFASQQLPQTVVIITRLPDTAHSANCPQYDGPLCTPLAQFPPYYYYQLNPAPQLGQSAPPFTVEECVDTTKVHVPLAQLYIGHDVSDTVQVLPKTPGTLGLACDPQTGMGPRRNMFELARKGDVSGAASELASRLEGLFVKTAYALETSSGVTGQTRSFSPFGIVDANDFVAYQNGGWTYHAPPTFTNPPPHDWGDVAGFQTPTYVPDGTWTLNTSPYGNAPFGSGSAGFGCALSALPNENLVWPSFNPVPGTTGNVDADSSTIFLLRANFYVPSTWSQDLNVGIAVDNDVEVFVNGTQVFVSPSQPPPTTSGLGFYVHEGCASQDSFVLDVPQALLLLGQKNLIAIRARDRGGESYIDARLSPATPVTPAP